MSAQENAEAILIVIKKLGKWLMFGILILVLLISLTVGYESFERYYNYDRHKKLVEIEVSFNKEFCTVDYPLFIWVRNNSTKKVMKVDVDVTVTQKGRSTKLNNYHTFVSDVILKPKMVDGYCYSIYDDNISNPEILSGENMEVVTSNYSVTFE